MKTHTKKKAYRNWLKAEAKAGKINNERGQLVPRNSISDSSMRRDYSPQSGKA